MQYYLIKLWGLFIFLTIVLSCESEHEISLPQHQPKLVLNGLLKHNSEIEFYITSSSGMYGQSNNKVQNVRCRFYENEIEVFPQVEQEQTLYKTTLIARSGVKYGIKVEAPGFDPIYSEDIIPFSAQFRMIEHKPKVGVYTDGDYYSEMVFKQFSDESEYYELLALF